MAKKVSKPVKKPAKIEKKAAKPSKNAKTKEVKASAAKKSSKGVDKKSSKASAAQNKKTVAKSPVKKAETKKVVAKKAAPDKKTAQKATSVKKAAVAEKKSAKPVKTKVSDKSQEKVAAQKAKATPVAAEKVADKNSNKKAAVANTKNKPAKTAKKNEEDLDDVLFDEDLGDSEITEYEEELAIVEEIDSVEETSEEEVVAETKVRGDSEEIILTDAEGRRYCRARDCDQAAIVDAYCRYHYLLFWKKIQNRKKILADGKLERYIEELTSRYPDKFLEMIRRDLRTEKDFLAAIQELEIDESNNENDFEEDTSAFIEEVRGMGESTGVEDDDF